MWAVEQLAFNLDDTEWEDCGVSIEATAGYLTHRDANTGWREVQLPVFYHPDDGGPITVELPRRGFYILSAYEWY